MNFGIKRLYAEEGSGRRYHLFDGKGKLALVVDYGSPWLPVDSPRRVYLARSGGQVVATFDLAEGEGRGRNGRSRTSYALIVDHAVYAILNEYQETTGAEPPFFTIEVDGVIWLAWSETEDDALLTLYSDVPSNLMIVNDPFESGQLNPVGVAYRVTGEYDFTVTLSVNPLHRADLIALCLIFLFEQGDLYLIP